MECSEDDIQHADENRSLYGPLSGANVRRTRWIIEQWRHRNNNNVENLKLRNSIFKKNLRNSTTFYNYWNFN